MPRYINPRQKSPELQRAEEEAGAALRDFFARDLGVQAQLARDSGLAPAVLSRMGKGRHPISVEQAMRIEIASQGALRVEQLCPARAEVLGRFLLHRAVSLGLADRA